MEEILVISEKSANMSYITFVLTLYMFVISMKIQHGLLCLSACKYTNEHLTIILMNFYILSYTYYHFNGSVGGLV